MIAEVQRTVSQLSGVSPAAAKLTLAVYATRRAMWGAPLDAFFGCVAPTVDAALTALDAVATEFALTEHHQVAMMLRYFDTTPPESGPGAVLDFIHKFAEDSRRARAEAELAAFAEAAVAPRPVSELPPPPSVAVAPSANTAEAQAALRRAAEAGYVPPVATVPAAPAPVVPAPVAAPAVVAPPPAVATAHTPMPVDWQQPAALAAPTPAPTVVAPTALAAGTRVAYQLGPTALTATVIDAGAGHAAIRVDGGGVYESVAWQYLHPTSAPLIIQATLAPTVAAAVTALAEGQVPDVPVQQGNVLCGLVCTTIAEPGTGRDCQLLLDLVAGPQPTQHLLSLRIETAQHEVLAQATYMLDALAAPHALRLQYRDCLVGYDVTIPTAPAAAVPTKRQRGKKQATETAPLPGQGTLPLETAGAGAG